MHANVFVDSNIWLYALIKKNDNDLRYVQANQLLSSNIRFTISTQVIREVSINLLKKARMPEAEIRRLISQWYVDCHIVKTTENQFLNASRLRETLALSYWDSLIIAAALESNCSILYTEDMQHGQVIEKRLTLINPFIELRHLVQPGSLNKF